jgi:DNA-binding NarL/FixJ family response regulator
VRQLDVLLVDKSEAFMEAVSNWLTADPMFRVVGKLTDGREALDRVAQSAPDLVLVDTDTTLSGLNGFEVARSIKRLTDHPRVVLVAFHDSETARLAAQAAGADDLIAKSDVTSGLESVVGGLVAQRADGPMGGRPQGATVETVDWRPGGGSGTAPRDTRRSTRPTKPSEEEI